MSNQFFDYNSYFIDEKVNFFKFENCYKVYNDQGEPVGMINQKLSGGQKLLRLLLNKAMLPFLLEIKDVNDNVVATITRDWTFFLSKITVTNPDGVVVGIIRQKFKLFKPTFKIYNTSEELIAEISGDWKAWNFKIQDASNNQIGTINKKWAGAMQEIFTSADKYNVNINTDFSSMENKVAILAGAITIDMVLKESK
jgi:uncharacterized protein YxjI